MRDAIRSRAAWIMSMLSINSFVISFCLFVATEFKHLGEIRHQPILYDAQFRLVAEQLFHRSDRLTFASDYQVEVTQICIDVERKAMCGDPARDVNSNGSNFAPPSVNSGQAG